MTALNSIPRQLSVSDDRLDELIDNAHALLRSAIAEHVTGFRDRRGRGRTLAATCILYSGGNDSTVLAHMFRNVATHAIHANTGIGIEDTRQFVRDTCAGWNLPLIEERGDDYEALVTEHGFPGPAHHWKMYQRLKERALEAACRGISMSPYRERIVFLAGRRASESPRRAKRAENGELKPVEIRAWRKSVVWVSPLHNWTALDLNAYRRRFSDCPRNPVADHLHMSGECLCGSFAKPGELDHIGFFYPEVKAGIQALEQRVAAAGIAPPERCKWGWGTAGRASKSGPLCSSCEVTR